MIEISFYLNLQGNKYHKSTLATGRTFGGETEVSSFHSGGCGELESLHHNVMLGGGGNVIKDEIDACLWQKIIESIRGFLSKMKHKIWVV